MKTKARSIEQIIEEQMRRWQIMGKEEKKEEERISVVTFPESVEVGETFWPSVLPKNWDTNYSTRKSSIIWLKVPV